MVNRPVGVGEGQGREVGGLPSDAGPGEVELAVVRGKSRACKALLVVRGDELAGERGTVIVGVHQVDVLVAGAAEGDEQSAVVRGERGGRVASGVGDDDLLLKP